ncbi:gamma-butyrobetaine hydroxylase-like domain-containing protein [Hyphomonas sp.]|uniref:gamma-butyrobetaine hydroxylase-like domain-containing protein n=1 Tax=Hyphomonas sp. TaxID=87 RepID=UPI003D2C82D9|tara:strand:- start:1470 stop:1775 length:306 start_codon:yes stop_codon:yes gene_type:complete
MSAPAWPVRLTFARGRRELVAAFDDGSSGSVDFVRLRENSPSAEVQGHGAGPKPVQAPVPPDITVERAEPVGRYAVRIFFSDGHSSGLYTWDLLKRLTVGA